MLLEMREISTKFCKKSHIAQKLTLCVCTVLKGAHTVSQMGMTVGS